MPQCATNLMMNKQCRTTQWEGREMKSQFRTIAIGAILVMVGSALAASTLLAEPSAQPVHNLDTGEDFSSIQDAINDADTQDGHTIAVDGRIYRENILVNKALRLLGQGKDTTIISGGTVVSITSDNVTLSGFTISSGIIGISLCSDKSTISNNVIHSRGSSTFICMRDGGDAIGIKITSSHDTTIEDNLISGVKGGDGADDKYCYGHLPEKAKGGDGYGILISLSSDITISGNTISGIEGGKGGKTGYSTRPRKPGYGGDAYGIFESTSPNITIFRNTVTSIAGGNGGVCGGINCYGSTRGGDGYGVYVSSSNNMIFNNMISDVEGGLGFGNNALEPPYVIPSHCGKGYKGYDDSSGGNAWDNGPNLGGNYWASNCKGNPSNGSQPYHIHGSADAQDRYPFQDPKGWMKSSVWLYEVEEKDQEHIVTQLNKYGINRVYLSVNPDRLIEDAAYEKIISDFIDLAWNGNRIEVHAMVLEDPNFALRPCHPDAIEDVKKILEYNANNLGTPFLGVHIDVEPYTLQDWKDGNWTDRDQIMEQYVELLQKVDSTIDNADQPIEFSATIAWWYNEWADQGLLPHGDTSLLAPYVDTLVPLVYGGIGHSAEDIEWRVSDEINEIDGNPLPTRVMIGVGATEFATYDQINQCIEQLNGEFYAKGCYGGTSIFDYDFYNLIYGALFQ